MRILRDMMGALQAARMAKDLWEEVFGVKLPPNVGRDSQGRVWPAPGFWWVHPNDAGNLDVRWDPGRPHPVHPHVVAGGILNKWCAEGGWHFVTREDGDFRVERDHEPMRPSAAEIQRIQDLALLGLGEGAGPEDVARSFRELAKLHHPDRFFGEDEATVESAKQAFIRLQAARDRLLASGGGS